MSGPKKAAAGWGSVFSSAITNLESRLDNILADESELAAKQRLKAEKQATGSRSRANSGRLAAPPSNASGPRSRDASRTRVNDRLAERLAKATAQKAPSRVATPVTDADSVRTSGEVQRSADIARPASDIELAGRNEDQQGGSAAVEAVPSLDVAERPATSEDVALATSSLPINPARISTESTRASVEHDRKQQPTARSSSDLPNGDSSVAKSAAELQADIERMQSDHAAVEFQRQEEMNVYMERIDALQAKLTYLANETVAAAKEANASARAGTLEEQIAEKDQRIALLMEEGGKLSKNEMKHLQTIKKLRSKSTDDERRNAELKKKLERAEKAEVELKAKLRRAETTERQANEKTRQIAAIERQIEELRVDRENAADLVRSLTTQLKEAKDRAAKAESSSKSSEADKNKIAELQNELEDAQIEKRLAEDRATSEIKKMKDDAQRQVERFSVTELELKNEISGLESRLEAMRSRAEEASSSGGATDGESSVKLMRQIETLQKQYALAKGNWETIEGSLNARVAALEKERDDVAKRESELRKKVRDTSNKARKAEDELESTFDSLKTVEQELSSQQAQLVTLQSRLEEAQANHSDTKADFDKQRKLWEAEFAQRLEEEKLRWRREMLGSSANAMNSPRTESLAAFTRKGSGTDITSRKALSRLTSHELVTLHTDQRPVSRRSSAVPPPGSARAVAPPSEPSPSISRRESTLSFDTHNMPPTPSIEIGDRISEDGAHSASPQRTIYDIVSTSTAGPGAGPSVQLVERMSSLVRKLESEKASFKDELSRLSAQRDDARNEVVELMREVQAKRTGETKVADLEQEINTLKARYDASLEMLGEKEEEVEELREDVDELKRIYKDLAEQKFSTGK
ncbi:TATA element modulatory factor [Fulvia fulva]|uniref:TATA element modulatory factor n=1 Tax=Passalora fulva TaxID=5499 RepID=A0A9Q8L936_PASFU|nr:TATA element modulatory factor [Fulvia fulva]KAK4634620.1 TATA element modulatory factor [Fulvia fulva]KAK4636717.1 TATA element modulatory factor [Fulvia fulva]UJO12969.1 TATA element modulatory factor [Fulvia fulva]WPV09263.1 TATA element modulatory factor [Fulvia fulva]WPV23938.1 TATA element modulatory factor [Fulvia fulva]